MIRIVLALVVILAVVIVTPIVIRMIQDWDYNRQIHGKRPMREFHGKQNVSTEEPFGSGVQLEIDKAKADGFASSGMNIMGPH